MAGLISKTADDLAEVFEVQSDGRGCGSLRCFGRRQTQWNALRWRLMAFRAAVGYPRQQPERYANGPFQRQRNRVTFYQARLILLNWL